MRMRRGRMLSARIGVGLAVFFLTLGLGAAFGVARGLRPALEKLFPERKLIVRPPALNVALLKLQTLNINDESLAAIRAIPGVARVDPQMPIGFPIHAEGTLGPTQEEIVTEIVVHGAPRDLVADGIPDDESFEWKMGEARPCPVVVSSYFLDLYNLGISESTGLPKLNESAMIGRKFNLVLGESVIVMGAGSGKRKTVGCAVVGFTRDPNLAGIAIPLGAVRAFNEWYSGADFVAKYNVVQIEVASTGDLEPVASAIRAMGYTASMPGKAFEQWRWAMRGGAALALLLALGVLFIALGNVVNTFALTLIERREEIGLLQALGASRRLVRRLYLAEIAWVGLTAAAGGAAAATVAALIVTQFLSRLTSGLATLRDLSVVPGWMVLAGVIVGVIGLSLAVTWPVVTRATHTAPAQLLRDQ